MSTVDLVATPTSCGPPGSQRPGSLQGHRGHGKEFGGQNAAPPPLDASKTEPRQNSIPCLEVPGAAGMQGVGLGVGNSRQKSSCQQCGSQSRFGEGATSTQHLGSAALAVAPAAHTTLLGSVLSVTCQSSGLVLSLSPSIMTTRQLHPSISVASLSLPCQS